MSEVQRRSSIRHISRRLWPLLPLDLYGLMACVLVSIAQGPSLLADDTTDVKKTVKPADNSYCLVCHANLKREELNSVHQKVGVGCAKCHGESDNHSADEDALTAPDILYARDKIAPACLKCHMPKTIADVPDHAPFVEEPSPKTEKGPAKIKTCTDCHGKHRLEVRTRKWDKNTRKLLADDGVRMMQTNSPARSAR